MELQNLIRDGLATYRVAMLLSQEDGPGQIFDRLRGLGVPVIAEGLNCPLCVSVWAGLAMPLIPKPLKYALAASAIAVVLFEYFDDSIDDEEFEVAEAVVDDIKRAVDMFVGETLLSQGEGQILIDAALNSLDHHSR